MKLKWPKKVKYSCMGVGVAISILSTGLVVKEANTVHKQVTEQVLCTYQNKSDLTYEVKVNSTKLYDQKVIQPDQYYVSSYADMLEATFTNDYTSSEAAEIQGNYKITAQLRGYAEEQEGTEVKKVTVWSKTETLKDTTPFKEKANAYHINEKIKLDLKKYNAFIKQLQEQEEIFIPTEVIVTISGKQQAHLPKETVDMPISATFTVPINEPYFKVEKQVAEPMEGKQTQEVTTLLPTNQKLMIGEGCVGAVSFIICILIGLLVTDIGEEEKAARRMKRIYTEYGSRLIGIDFINEEKFSTCYKVGQLEDLIKLSDELGKPIVFEKGEALSNLNFYIIDHHTLYSYTLEEQIAQAMKENDLMEELIKKEEVDEED